MDSRERCEIWVGDYKSPINRWMHARPGGTGDHKKKKKRGLMGRKRCRSCVTRRSSRDCVIILTNFRSRNAIFNVFFRLGWIHKVRHITEMSLLEKNRGETSFMNVLLTSLIDDNLPGVWLTARRSHLGPHPNEMCQIIVLWLPTLCRAHNGTCHLQGASFKFPSKNASRITFKRFLIQDDAIKIQIANKIVESKTCLMFNNSHTAKLIRVVWWRSRAIIYRHNEAFELV